MGNGTEQQIQVGGGHHQLNSKRIVLREGLPEENHPGGWCGACS